MAMREQDLIVPASLALTSAVFSLRTEASAVFAVNHHSGLTATHLSYPSGDKP
jgi:hypothetical protein